MDEIVKRIEALKSFKEYDYKKMVDDAYKIGKAIAGKPNEVTHTSLRNIHSEVVRIKSLIQNEESEYAAKSRINLLKPKVSYLRARAKHYNVNGLKIVERAITACVNKISDKDDILKFKDFYDAILMYHKAEGGQ